MPTNLVIRKHWQSDVVSSCSAAVHAVCYAINNARTGYVDTMRPYIHSRTFPVGTVWTPLSFFYTRDAMLARILAMALCLCLSQVGVLSKRLKKLDWFSARELPLAYPTLCWKNKGTSFWNFTLNSGLRKFRHLEACYQLSSRKVDAQSVMNWAVVGQLSW